MEMDFSVSDGASVVPEEHNDSDDTPIVNSGSKRFRTRTLDAWNYFNRVVVVDEKGTRREKATCKACEKIYWSLSFSKSGTSTLNRHTDKCKSTSSSLFNEETQELNSGVASSDHNITQEGYREKLAIAVIKHAYSFSWVEHEANRDIHRYLNSSVNPISRNTVKSDILKIHARMKEELKITLQKIPGRICLTSDMWTSLTTRSFLCLTAHYIDENVWKIHLQLLQICSSSDDVLKNMGNLMLLKFKKYWEDYNLVLAFGVILDPRYKVDFVKFCYEKLGGDYSNKWLDIREQLYLMFEEYQNMNGSVLDSTTSTLDISTDLDTDEFDSFHVNLRRSGKSELQLYLEDPLLPRVKEVNGVRISHVIDVLEWWKKIEYRYPQLSRMARDILSIPITSVASESSFSLGGRVLNKWRTCILSDTLEALMTTRNWLYGYKIEEDGEGIEDEGEVINLI
ncbi:Zinc finger BED domain-containing protein DAYSLEEPER [Linum grandiflorum]